MLPPALFRRCRLTRLVVVPLPFQTGHIRLDVGIGPQVHI